MLRPQCPRCTLADVLPGSQSSLPYMRQSDYLSWTVSPLHRSSKTFPSSSCKVMAAESTASCGKHLIGAHGIHAPGTHPPVGGDSKLVMRSCPEGVYPLHAERWREDFINWIAHDYITFEQAASPRLHKIILGGGPAIQHLLPCSRTLRSWLLKTYNECTADGKSSLACSRSKINLSFDVWSSPNHLSMLGIVGHWIDRQRNLKTGLLALRPLDGHRGNDIAVVLLPVIKTFNIEAELSMVQYKWYPVNRPLVNG